MVLLLLLSPLTVDHVVGVPEQDAAAPGRVVAQVARHAAGRGRRLQRARHAVRLVRAVLVDRPPLRLLKHQQARAVSERRVAARLLRNQSQSKKRLSRALKREIVL